MVNYVGLPMAIRFTNVNFDVVGYRSRSQESIFAQEIQSYLSHISQADIESLSNNAIFILRLMNQG